MQIHAGDLVRLLDDNGSYMNVRSVSERSAMCTWFDSTGRRHLDVFPLDRLYVIARIPGDRERVAPALWKQRAD